VRKQPAQRDTVSSGGCRVPVALHVCLHNQRFAAVSAVCGSTAVSFVMVLSCPLTIIVSDTKQGVGMSCSTLVPSKGRIDTKQDQRLACHAQQLHDTLAIAALSASYEIGGSCCQKQKQQYFVLQGSFACGTTAHVQLYSCCTTAPSRCSCSQIRRRLPDKKRPKPGACFQASR
jgi:hypothetical protein